MSGRRWWWPALVITASVAAQAHLMFALAASALVLLTLIIGLADAFRAKTGYLWTAAGLAAGRAADGDPAAGLPIAGALNHELMAAQWRPGTLVPRERPAAIAPAAWQSSRGWSSCHR